MPRRKSNKPTSRATKEERIEYIMDKMRRMEFRRGKEYPELMERFGVCRQSIVHDCAEASRNVRREINNPDQVAVDIGQAFLKQLEAAVEDAERMRGTREGLTARDQIIRLGKVWSDISGASSPIQHEVTSRLEVTPARANELVREKLSRSGPKGEEE